MKASTAVRRPAPKKTGKRGPIPEDPKPKQGDLPGMEDREIAEIESAAESYASLRDRRMDLNKQEVDLRDKLLGMMKAHGKKEYNHAGISVRVVVESEKVKVRIKKDED